MSRRASYRYEVAHEAAAARVRAHTSAFLQKQQSTLDDLRSQGLDRYLPKDFAALAAEVADARNLLETDPFEARSISRNAGPRLYALAKAARDLRRRANSVEARAPQPKAHAKTPDTARGHKGVETDAESMEALWRHELSRCDDDLCLALAQSELQQIREKHFRGGSSPDASGLRAELRKTLKTYRLEADRVRASELARAQSEALREEADRVMQDLHLEDPARITLAEEIDRSRGSEATLLEAVSAAQDAIHGQEEAEESRRAAVKAVYDALTTAGFVVDQPVLVPTPEGDEVVVRGRRPSGAAATFGIDLTGHLRYDFDGYRGSECEADIDAVVPSLQAAYGISLSDHRILWQNPDEIDQTAKPRPSRSAEH